MIFKATGLAMLGMAGALMAPPAMAQQPPAEDEQFAELMCVYNELLDLDDEKYFDVVDAHMKDVTEGDLYDSAFGSILPAATACAEQHDWTADEQEIAITIGVYGTVGDAIEGELLDAGVKEEQLDTFIEVLDELETDDLFAFASGTWREDAPLKQRIATGLKARGYPSDATLLSHGNFLIESYVMGMIQMEAWLEDAN